MVEVLSLLYLLYTLLSRGVRINNLLEHRHYRKEHDNEEQHDEWVDEWVDFSVHGGVPLVVGLISISSSIPLVKGARKVIVNS